MPIIVLVRVILHDKVVVIEKEYIELFMCTAVCEIKSTHGIV